MSLYFFIGVALGLYICLVPISPSAFDHGGTRLLRLDMTDADLVIFMTQDAVLAGVDSFERLLAVFADLRVGAAFGRQLPRVGADLIESHARLFNYSAQNRTVSQVDIDRLGLRAAFLSDSFAAYRREALLAVGGFQRRTIMGEDMMAGAKLLLAGWSIVYCADSPVYHSHRYGWRQEFSRYFDTGVMHARDPWLLDKLGGASGEGMKFVHSELAFLWQSGNGGLIGVALFRTAAKFIGYHLGRKEKWLPLNCKKCLGMNTGYWEKM